MSSEAKLSDLELIISGFTRNHYDKKVPEALTNLTMKFSKQIIGCKLLTPKQDLQFFQLLSKKLPSMPRFNLLFRASDHQYSADKFHENCDNKPGTITIIKSNHGNIFGGYTSKSWKSNSNESVKDENAFLFLIQSDDKSIQKKCPLLLELKKDHEKFAIYCVDDFGPIFGNGFDICIRDNCNKELISPLRLENENYAIQESFDGDIKYLNICGKGRRFFQVIDYEVFQII